MRYILLALFLCACAPKNEMSEMTNEIIRKKEGIDIRMTPIDEVKSGPTLGYITF